MVDEMNLLSGLKDTEPMSPRAYDDARAVLLTAMKPRRRIRWGAVSFSTAALAAAALAAVSVSTPDEPPAPKAVQAAGNPILADLVAYNTPLPVNLPGNATLEIRNQSPTSKELGGNGIGLFTDDGTYYWGTDKAALRRAVVEADGGEDMFKRDIAAALYAVKGDLTTARAQMAVSNLVPGAKPDQTRAKKGPVKERTPDQQKEITDNHIWTNAVDALLAAPENPQVRAGVLRLMTTMPNVKVTRTTTAGHPTLTLTDTWSVTGRITETLILNPTTGQPLARTSTTPDLPPRTTYHHNSRVTLTAIKTGNF
jgi:hypothetical protein